VIPIDINKFGSLESLESIMATKRDMHKVVRNTKLPFKAVSSVWYVGDIEPIQHPDDKGGEIHGYGQLRKRMRAVDRLPDNFYMRELLDVDTEDNEALALFLSEWGFPLSPYRELQFTVNGNVAGQLDCGKAETDLLEHTFFKETKYGGFISTTEAIEAIGIFKDFVLNMFEVISGKDALEVLLDVMPIWLAQDAGTTIGIATIETPPGKNGGRRFQLGLSNAIANQIIDVIGDDAGWYRCENPDCQRWFKYKRGSKNPINNSIYCSEECQRHMKVLRQDKRRKEAKHED
jgi:hypothetical protein